MAYENGGIVIEDFKITRLKANNCGCIKTFFKISSPIKVDF